jgi:ribonuclease BN (tRNA processing enzyme)
MRLTVVGCAGSFPGPASPASSYLLEAEGFRLVLDMGNGSLGVLQRHIGLFDVDAICLSHLHADHCIDLYSYQIARQYAPEGPLSPIPVYGPTGTAERIDMIHGPGGDGELAGRFTYATLTPGTLEIGPFRVTTDHMNHPVETFGFRVEQGGRTITYSADTGETGSLVRLARDADVLLAEASFLEGPDNPPDLHLTGLQAGEHAARADAGRLVLTHLVVWNSPVRSVEEAISAYDGTVTTASTGTVIELDGAR